MIVENITRNTIVAFEVQVANTFIDRLKGLLGTSNLDRGKCLIIAPCNSIHTIGMKYMLDILFVDQKDKVLKIVADIPAGSFAACRSASYVVELPAGAIVSTGTSVGDKLAIL